VSCIYEFEKGNSNVRERNKANGSTPSPHSPMRNYQCRPAISPVHSRDPQASYHLCSLAGCEHASIEVPAQVLPP
jgi:hypothetical protein